MATKVLVLAGGDPYMPEGSFDYYVGIDRGGSFLLSRDMPLDMAIGDFDSVSESEMHRITQASHDLIKLRSDKDDTDLETGLKAVFRRFPQAQVMVAGVTGGRLDHLLAACHLPDDPGLAPFMRQITLVDRHNHIRFFPPGTHAISPIAGMTYVAFMASDKSPITLENAAYPLLTGHGMIKGCYPSNHYIGDTPIIAHLDTGYLIVIDSKE